MALNAVAKVGHFFHQLGLVLTTVARVTLLEHRCIRNNPQLLWLSRSESRI